MSKGEIDFHFVILHLTDFAEGEKLGFVNASVL